MNASKLCALSLCAAVASAAAAAPATYQRFIGTGVIGAITVSGVPQREDHGFVVEMICAHLGQDYAPLALGPETP